MPFEINLLEPKYCDYLFIDTNNKVHLLVPIAGGDTIGLDNTCKMAVELKKFLLGSNNHLSAIKQLNNYCKNLSKDIAYLPLGDFLRNQKIDRLKQIEDYVKILKIISQEFLYPELTARYVKFPVAVNTVMSRQNNCLAMRLSPFDPDDFTVIEDPVFSLSRKQYSNGSYEYFGDSLSKTLTESFNKVRFNNSKNAKDNVIDLAVKKLGDYRGALLSDVRNAIISSVNELYGQNNNDLSGFSVDLTVRSNEVGVREQIK